MKKLVDKDLTIRHGVPQRLSFSQVSMWLRCPRQYLYRYLMDLKMPPGGAQIQGSAYHFAIAEALKVKKDKGELVTEEDFKGMFDQGWKDKLKTGEKIDWRGNKPGVLKDEGMNVGLVYHEKIIPTLKPKEIEVRDVIEVKGIPFIRIKDLILESGNIVDHKLASKRYSESGIHSDLQSLAYLYPNSGTFTYHVGLKLKVPDVQIMPYKRTLLEIKWWEELVEEVFKAINAGMYPPNPLGWYCSPKWCGFWDVCRGGKNKKV